MRRQIQFVPRKLPSVRLYLDDIEAIIKILAEELEATKRDQAREMAEERLKWMPKKIGNDSTAQVEEPKEPEIQIRSLFRIGSVEMDSIDDLLYQGGSVKDLTVSIQSRKEQYVSSCGLEFRHYSEPELNLIALGTVDQQWKVYAQVLEICKRRRMAVKEFFLSLPYWLRNGSFVLIWPLILAAVESKGLAHIILTTITLIALPIIVIGTIAATRPSRVYLVRSHEKDKVATETRKKYRDLIFTLILGGAIAELIRYFGGKLLK